MASSNAVDPDVTSTFFAGLRSLARTVEDQSADLYLKASVTSWRRGDSEASPMADSLLESVQAMRSEVDSIATEAANYNDRLNRLLEDSEQQFKELVADVQTYESWAAEYGYKPRLRDVDDLKEEEKEEDTEQVRPNSAEPTEDSSAAAAKAAKAESPPSVFEAGLSKATLKALGITFKDSGGKKQREARTEAAVRENNVGVANGTYIVNNSSFSTSFSTSLTAANESLAFNTFSTDSDSDTTTPISIIKKPSLVLYTPNGPPATPMQNPVEMSQIEITPGLYIRRPSSRGQTKEQKKEPPKPAVLPRPRLSSSPVEPELKTVDIQKLLRDAQARTGNNSSSLYSSPKANSENVNPDRTPEEPVMSTRKMRQVLAESAKKRAAGSSVAAVSSSSVLLTPEPPKLSEATMLMLQRKGLIQGETQL